MRRQLVSLVVSLTVVFGAGVLHAAEPLPVKPPSPTLVLPALSLSGKCAPIDFDGVQIAYSRTRGLYQLTITGIKPYANMEVSLNSEPSGRGRAYRRTTVIGCVKNFIVLPLATPYFMTVPLAPLAGTRGVEIVGASGSVRRNAPRR